MLDGSSLAQSPQTLVYSTISRFVACGSILSVIPLSFHRMWLNPPFSYSTVSRFVACGSILPVVSSIPSTHLQYQSTRSRSSVVPSRLHILGIFVLQLTGFSTKHSRTIAVLRTFAFKSFRMLRFICLWQTLRCCRCSAVGKHPRSRSSHSSHSSHSRLSPLPSARTPSNLVYQIFSLSLSVSFNRAYTFVTCVSLRYRLHHSAILWFLQFVSSASRILEVFHLVAAPHRRRP
jgi:hypothetical protein